MSVAKRRIAAVFLLLLSYFGPPLNSPVHAADAPIPSSQSIRGVETPKESQIRQLREQEITQIRIALGRRLPENRKADLYFRLAELYIEAYQHSFLMEGRIQQTHLDSGQKKAKLERGISKPYLRLGIQACEQLIKLNAQTKRMDEIYYYLGYNYSELGETKKSQEYYKALTSRYPNSIYAFEAFREVGDQAFLTQDYRKAQADYEQAMRTRKAALGPQPRMLYHLAWTYYRLKQFDRAISTMKNAIKEASQEDERFLSIREEAMRDMAVFMTERGNVDEALAYFSSIQNDDTYYPKVLEKLGREYERTVQLPKAMQVYETLLRTKPNSESAFRVSIKLIELELKKGERAKALAAIRKLQFKADRSAESEIAYQNLRAEVRRTATENHDYFRKKKAGKESLKIAEDFYTVYLDTFLVQGDSRKEASEIKMYLADVKRELGKSAEASNIYKEIVEAKDPKYAKEAVGLWVGSLADALKNVKPEKRAAPTPIEREFVDAALFLEDKQGVSAQTTELLLRSAQLLAAYPTTQKEALGYADKVIARAPSSKSAITAAMLKVQLAGDAVRANKGGKESASDNADQLRQVVEEIKGNAALLAADKKIGKGELTQIVATQEEKFRVSGIQKLEAAQDYQKAALEYEKFAAESKDPEKAEKSYNNAVVYYGKAGDPDSMVRVAGLWLHRFPKSEKASSYIKDNATRQFIAGQFEVAAAAFASLASSFGDGAAYETAAKIYAALKKYPEAEKAYRDLFRSSPKYAQAGEALLGQAHVFEAQGKDPEVVETYRKCSAFKELEAECQARMGDYYAKSKNLDLAVRAYQKALRTKGASPFRAYAAYQMAFLSEKDVSFAPFSASKEKLKSQLDARIAQAGRLSKAYTPAIEAGGPWGIAALNRLAQYVLGMSTELDRIDIPGPSADRDAQLAEIRKISGSLKQQAAQTFHKAFEQASREEILSPTLPEIHASLAFLKVQRSMAAQGPHGGYRIAGLPADGGKAGRSDALESVRKKLIANSSDAPAWNDYGNLLWGQGQEDLAKVAYERALAASPGLNAALNNRAAVVLNAASDIDWYRALEAQHLLKRAIEKDAFFVSAKTNLALLYNYYGLFERALPLWEQIAVKQPKDAQIEAGTAIALQGTGKKADAAKMFDKADADGLKTSGFAYRFHEAARQVDRGDCKSKLGKLSPDELVGLEKISYDLLKKECD